MAMEMKGNFTDYAIRSYNYGGYAAQSPARSGAADGVKKEETGNRSERAGDGKPKSTTAYADELAKLVPSMEFKIGNTFSSAKSGKTLTVHPQLLEKMQNDPEKEKEMKELIRGVESAVRMLESINKASGWTVVYKHCYIDENGKFCSIAHLRNDFMLNMSDKLREERRKNAEKLIEKTKEKAAEKKKELQEIFEEMKEEEQKEEAAKKADTGSAYNRAEELLKEKMAASKDGSIYLDDTDIRTMIEAAREDDADKDSTKERMPLGANLDLWI